MLSGGHRRAQQQSTHRGSIMITFAEDGKPVNPIEPHQREWALFFIFGLAELDADPEG
jgi:hypothetical protein